METAPQNPLTAALSQLLSLCRADAVVFSAWQAVSAVIALVKLFFAIGYSFCASETEEIG